MSSRTSAAAALCTIVDAVFTFPAKRSWLAHQQSVDLRIWQPPPTAAAAAAAGTASFICALHHASNHLM